MHLLCHLPGRAEVALCVGLQLQAFFLVADDIMDGSITRRGQPCWYKVPKVSVRLLTAWLRFV